VGQSKRGTGHWEGENVKKGKKVILGERGVPRLACKGDCSGHCGGIEKKKEDELRSPKKGKKSQKKKRSHSTQKSHTAKKRKEVLAGRTKKNATIEVPPFRKKKKKEHYSKGEKNQYPQIRARTGRARNDEAALGGLRNVQR